MRQTWQASGQQAVWKRAGFALVAVLATLALFAALVAGYGEATHNRVKRSAQRAENIQRDVLRETMEVVLVERLLARFVDKEAQQAIAVDGRWFRCSFPEIGEVVFSLQDLAGLVDVNTATPVLFVDLVARFADNLMNVDVVAEERAQGFRYLSFRQLQARWSISSEALDQLVSHMTFHSGQSSLATAAMSASMKALGLSQSNATTQLSQRRYRLAFRKANKVFASDVELTPGEQRGYRLLGHLEYLGPIITPAQAC